LKEAQIVIEQWRNQFNASRLLIARISATCAADIHSLLPIWIIMPASSSLNPLGPKYPSISQLCGILPQNSQF
jgi:hypothetical protein